MRTEGEDQAAPARSFRSTRGATAEPLCVQNTAILPAVSPEFAVLRASILDLRANLEAKLRVCSALNDVVDRFDSDSHARDRALREITNYLASLTSLHGVSTEMIGASDAALKALITATDSAAPPSSSV